MKFFHTNSCKDTKKSRYPKMESTIFVFLPIKIEFHNDLVPIFENSTSCFEKKDELCLEPVDWHSAVE